MRYFLKTTDGETGPFEDTALALSLRERRISESSMIRRETETLWRPLQPELDKSLAARAMDAEPKRRRKRPLADVPPGSEWSNDRGSFGLGMVLGFLGGCLTLILFLRRARPETKRGVYWGFAIQLALLLLVGLLQKR